MKKYAKRIKDIDGLSQLLIDMKPKRCDSDVYINKKIDVTNLVEYVETHKKGKNKLTYTHAFITALGKTIYNRPKLNRYIANRHVYERKEVVVSFVAKVSFDDKSEEVMVLIPIDANDDIKTISKKIFNKVDEIRNSKALKEGANSAIGLIGKLPNIIRIPIVGMFKWFDKKGILPASLIKDNLYYSSIIVSNLGSIKCGAIHHNLTNFGTASSFATIGEIQDVEIINEKGKKEIRKICEFGINLDERVADGYYMSKSLSIFQHFIDNPKLLEEKISEKFDVKEIR